MGIEDRDWYRDKQIDWDRGGLRERTFGRRRAPQYRRWILVAILLLIVAALFLFLSVSLPAFRTILR